MDEFKKKKIDEEWKKRIREKKDMPSGGTGEKDGERSKNAFSAFISGLAVQGLIFLGEIPSPLDKQKKLDLKQASYIIDTLEMLQKKTEGNLSPEEKSSLEALLYQLRMKYVEKGQVK